MSPGFAASAAAWSVQYGAAEVPVPESVHAELALLTNSVFCPTACAVIGVREAAAMSVAAEAATTRGRMSPHLWFQLCCEEVLS
jgi:hypothetical protein